MLMWWILWLLFAYVAWTCSLYKTEIKGCAFTKVQNVKLQHTCTFTELTLLTVQTFHVVQTAAKVSSACPWVGRGGWMCWHDAGCNHSKTSEVLIVFPLLRLLPLLFFLLLYVSMTTSVTLQIQFNNANTENINQQMNFNVLLVRIRLGG